MFTETTNNITVNVLPVYIDEQSDPENNRYFWAYRIVIENYSGKTVQLLSRYWHITDANGHVEEVRGEGVVGEQPILADGEEYAYTSGCPLTTSSGIMKGHFTMREEITRHQFEIEVPAFSLDLPDLNPILN